MQDDNEPQLLPLLEKRFHWVTPIQVIQLLPRYYPNTRRNDRVSSPKLLATYVFIIRNNLGDNKPEHSFREIAIQISVKHYQNAYRHWLRHHKFWEQSPRYRLKLLLCLNDINKLNESQQQRFQNKLLQHG